MNVPFVFDHEIIWVICITLAVPIFSLLFVKEHQFRSEASEMGGLVFSW